MANWFEPSAGEREAYSEWCASRAPEVRKLAERFPIWELLTIRQTGQPVYPVSFSEDGTITVARDPEVDWLAGVYHEVFGLKPDDLEPGAKPRLLKTN